MEPKRTRHRRLRATRPRHQGVRRAHDLHNFEYHDIDTFDFSDPAAYDQFDWDLYGTIINAGAFTAVDKAETAEGVLPRGRPMPRVRRCWPRSHASTTSRWCM